MRVIAKIGHLAQRLVRGLIHRLWIQPFKIRIIPRLSVEKPNRVQNLLLRLSNWSANAGRVLLEDIDLDIFRWVGPDWSVTYIGNGFSEEVISSVLFSDLPQTCLKSQAHLWQAPRLVHKYTGEGDLVVCELNRMIRLSSKDFSLAFTSPQWVDLTIEGIDRPLDEVMARIHSPVRSRIRRLETQGYHFVTTNSEVDFDLFYHRMYVPYVETRHNGHGAIMRSYDFIHNIFERGTLIIVKQYEELISGMVIQITGDTCLAVYMGVMDGRYELVKHGAVVALWWSAIQWAHEQGARRFNLGGSRPMVTNGSLDFKRQWGAQVFRDKEVYTQWNFSGKNIPTKLRDYLNRQGFITETPEGLALVVLFDPSKISEETDLSNQLKYTAKFGLAGVVLLSTTGKQKFVPCTPNEFDPTGEAHLALNENLAN